MPRIQQIGDDNMLTLKNAIETAGKVSHKNGKMPGSTFAISAKRCKVGSKLAAIEGTVCHKCYALRLQNFRPSVDKGWESNYLRATQMISTDPERWAQAAAFQIARIATKTGQSYHRWFDSGDLQSVDMLLAIMRVCELTPEIAHWLPTREARIVSIALAKRKCPDNLVIRVSSTHIGDKPLAVRGGFYLGANVKTSTVHRKGTDHHGHECPAPKQGNKCGSCRACWSRSVDNVSYPLH